MKNEISFFDSTQCTAINEDGKKSIFKENTDTYIVKYIVGPELSPRRKSKNLFFFAKIQTFSEKIEVPILPFS